jgi:hypothetical protein
MTSQRDDDEREGVPHPPPYVGFDLYRVAAIVQDPRRWMRLCHLGNAPPGLSASCVKPSHVPPRIARATPETVLGVVPSA